MKTLLFFSVYLSIVMVSAGELVSMKDYLKSSLNGAKKISKEEFKFSEDQKNTLVKLAPKSQDTSVTFFYGRDEKGSLSIACTVVPQQGKEGPMTVGICFQPDGQIKKVTILNFEEERGKPVKDETFLSQFKGKSNDSTFQVGQDINGVTGATHSSKAVSEAVRKASFGFREFVQKK